MYVDIYKDWCNSTNRTRKEVHVKLIDKQLGPGNLLQYILNFEVWAVRQSAQRAILLKSCAVSIHAHYVEKCTVY